MNNSANQCPQCKNFILGTHCAECKKDISQMNEMPDFFKDIFGGFNDK